jgi:hypothetical protein
MTKFFHMKITFVKKRVKCILLYKYMENISIKMDKFN